MTANRTERAAQAVARLKTKFVTTYYLLTIVTSTVILFVHGRLAFAADLVAAVFYLAMTALLYDLSQPKARSLRLLAALVHAAQEDL